MIQHFYFLGNEGWSQKSESAAACQVGLWFARILDCILILLTSERQRVSLKHNFNLKTSLPFFIKKVDANPVLKRMFPYVSHLLCSVRCTYQYYDTVQVCSEH